MTIYATGNPVGSTNPKDLIDNSQNLDYLSIGAALNYPDRKGVNRLSWAGIEASFAAKQAERDSLFNAAQVAREAEHDADQARRESEFDSAQSNRQTTFQADQARHEHEFDSAQLDRSSRFDTFIESSGYDVIGDYAAQPVTFTERNQLMLKDGEMWKPKASAALPYVTTGVWASESSLFVSVGDASLRQELASPPGATKVHYGNETVAQFLDKTKEFTETAVAFKKSVRLKLPLRFQDHAAALVAVGSPSAGYLYPQGHCYDSADNIFIRYANGNRSTMVWYDTNGVYGGWFLIENGGESVVIIEEGGTRKLYSKGGANKLYAYDITVMPVSGSILTFTDVGLSGVGLQYAYDNGRWLIEQISVDVGAESSRTKWIIYDRNFVKTGDFYVAKNVVGWQLAESPHYPFIPKTQGVAMRGDKVIFGLGGSYIPEIEGPVSPKSASVGVAVCDLDGTIAAYGVLRADQLITRLVSDGHICARTESEGVTLRPDGSISHILITVRPGHGAQTTDGILILNELDIDGDDYIDIAEQYSPFNMDRTQSGVFPRSADGKMYDPFSGAQFSTLAQIIAYMWDVQVPRFAWYTSAVAITPLPGMTFPSAMLVQIANANNLTYIISVSGTGGFRTEYSINYNPDAGTFSTTKLGHDMMRLRLGELDGSLNYNGRILTPHQNQTDADLLVLQQQSAPTGNLMTIGGGSSLYYACSRIWAYVGATLTTKLGTLVTETLTSGFHPGATGVFSLGYAGKLWSQLFASTATINTSDERLKKNIQPVDSLALDAWATVDYAQFKMQDAVEAKGDAARWHFGVIAQRVKEAFEAVGLDPFAYGVLCYDEWDEEAEVIESWGTEFDEHGVITREAGSAVVRAHVPAGNRYGVRYEEALVLEVALLRRTNQRQSELNAAFEARLAALEAE